MKKIRPYLNLIVSFSYSLMNFIEGESQIGDPFGVIGYFGKFIDQIPKERIFEYPVGD